ncbi:MAG: tetratricopeptide repeat protein, partial [Gemmatimonadetes bacterium]
MTDSLEGEIRELEAALGSARDPDRRAFVSLADALRRAGDLERALQVVREGLAAHPDLASARVVEAWILEAQGDDGAAREAWYAVLDLDAGNRFALAALARGALADGDTARARELIEAL